jgi:hypothetical protein
MGTRTRSDGKAETRKNSNQEPGAQQRGKGDDRTPNISPEATDHPALHALISTVILQGFAKPHHCVPVQQEASGTEVRKCIRSQARSRESTEPQAESSTKLILRLSAGNRGDKIRNREYVQDGGVGTQPSVRNRTEQKSDKATGHRAGSSSRSACLLCIACGG